MAGVATPHKKYEELAPQWERCRDCTNGGDAVKAKGTKYLPMLDSHILKPEKYIPYVLRALFYNAVGRTVLGLSGGIFQKAPAIETDDAQSKEHIKDITLTGQPLDLFALEATKEYLITGRYGILVDMSTEEAVTPRPYWVGYRAEDIINWHFTRMGGDQELDLVVLREYVDIHSETDEFEIKQKIQYRVLRLTEGIYSQQLYTEEAQQPGSLSTKFVGQAPTIPTRRGETLNFIPFALPWSIGTPPLLDLADVNLSHYRGSADLKHGLHFTALPTPWVSGQLGGGDKPLAIGSGTAWSLEKDGKAGMLEFTGQGLGAIRNDLHDMQKMMATLGARLLEEAPHYAETALSVSMRHSSDYSTLRTLAQIVEQQISWALKVHCWWISTKKLVTDMKANVELNKVFFDQQVTADELRALLLALQAGTISYESFYARLSNTGWMREGVSAEEELEDIKEDGDQFKPPVKGGSGIPSEKLGEKTASQGDGSGIATKPGQKGKVKPETSEEK